MTEAIRLLTTKCSHIPCYTEHDSTVTTTSNFSHSSLFALNLLTSEKSNSTTSAQINILPSISHFRNQVDPSVKCNSISFWASVLFKTFVEQYRKIKRTVYGFFFSTDIQKVLCERLQRCFILYSKGIWYIIFESKNRTRTTINTMQFEYTWEILNNWHNRGINSPDEILIEFLWCWRSMHWAFKGRALQVVSPIKEKGEKSNHIRFIGLKRRLSLEWDRLGSHLGTWDAMLTSLRVHIKDF